MTGAGQNRPSAPAALLLALLVCALGAAEAPNIVRPAPGVTGDPFMGTWSGSFRADSGEKGPFVMQVVPLGGDAYSLWVRMGEHGSRYQIQGARADGKLRFRGRYEMASGTDEAAYDLGGEIADDRVVGTFASSELNGVIELRRQRQSLPPRGPPAEAVRLYDGSFGENWQRAGGGSPDWAILPDGAWEVGAVDLETRKDFAGFRLHLEFWLPLQPAARGEQRGRSGVVVGGACEVHLLDTFGQEPGKGSCGAIFGVAAPRLDACLPPLEWQALDISLRAAALDAAGKPVQPAEITVALNGVVLHDRRKLDDVRRAPIRLRAGGSPVRFRNIWILPADE